MAGYTQSEAFPSMHFLLVLMTFCVMLKDGWEGGKFLLCHSNTFLKQCNPPAKSIVFTCIYPIIPCVWTEHALPEPNRACCNRKRLRKICRAFAYFPFFAWVRAMLSMLARIISWSFRKAVVWSFNTKVVWVVECKVDQSSVTCCYLQYVPNKPLQKQNMTDQILSSVNKPFPYSRESPQHRKQSYLFGRDRLTIAVGFPALTWDSSMPQYIPRDDIVWHQDCLEFLLW